MVHRFILKSVMHLFKILLFLVLSASLSPATASIDHYFDKIKSDPNALYAFFKEMPKGGELHYHLAGGVYPESMLAIAAQKNTCLDTQTLTMDSPSKNCLGIK